VLTVEPSATLGDVAALLTERKIGAVVVSDDGKKVSGIMSERDIVKAIALRGADVLQQPVSSAMTSSVVLCDPGETMHQVMGRMTSGRFRHLPVVENDELVGIISIGDVVKRRIEQVEAEAEEIRAYITSG
jgi:CBS domain-containing protein